MVLKADFAALARVKWHEYLIRFLLGGLVTLGTGVIAQAFGPLVGGLFLALPAIFPASATLLEKKEREKKRRAGIAFTFRGRLAAALDARGAVMGALAMIAFAGIVWIGMTHANVATVLGVALAVWLSLASLLWYARRHPPWSRKKTTMGANLH